MKREKIQAGLAAAMLTLGLGAGVQASVVQQVGNNWVVAEGENYDYTNGTKWITISTATPFTSGVGTTILSPTSNASGGKAVLSNTSGSGGVLGYDFVFTTPGTYYAYMHYSMFESGNDTNSYGNEDSVFVATAWNTVPTGTNAQSYDLNWYGFHNYTDGGWEGTYRWDKVYGRDANGTYHAVVTPFTITADDVANATVLRLYISSRENYASVDMIAFSTQSNLNDAQLTQLLTVPEPASLGLLTLASLPLIRRR